jgi:hemerythrin
MKTLLQCINGFIDNISVTDKQEASITGSVGNLDTALLKDDNGLFIRETFTTGSYERDTMIRPLDDVDVFAVLDYEKHKTEFGQYPSPQKVLTKIKDYLNGLPDYKDKAYQDRPCVSIELSKINFDVLPCFDAGNGVYYMPNHDLTSWTVTNPKTHTVELNKLNTESKGRLKSVIKAVKYWKREYKQNIPSYHVEEIAMLVFRNNVITNVKQGIEKWFEQGSGYMEMTKFDSIEEHGKVKEKVKKIHSKLKDAADKYEKNEAEAIKIWKEIFDKEFDVIDEAEARELSKALSEGSLKIGSTGVLSTTLGKTVPASSGFYGEDKKI